MLRSTMLVVAMAYGLAACGDDCDGGGFFSSSSSESAAAPIPTVVTSVLVDAGNTVVIEVVSTTPGGRCSAATPRTTRFVWDPMQGRAVATTAVPSSSARRITGAMLGGGVTTYENVIPGLTVRVARDASGNETITFTSGMTTSTLTCSTSFFVSCM